MNKTVEEIKQILKTGVIALSNVKPNTDQYGYRAGLQKALELLADLSTLSDEQKGMKWVKASDPPKERDDSIVAIIQQKKDGIITMRPAYVRWNERWIVENDWEVFEWLDESVSDEPKYIEPKDVDNYLLAHGINPDEVASNGNEIAKKILHAQGGTILNYGAMIDPEKQYPVIYSRKQDGTKIFHPRYTSGKYLTEPQIKYLYDSGYFETPFESVSDEGQKEEKKYSYQEIMDAIYTGRNSDNGYVDLQKVKEYLTSITNDK